MKAVVFFGTLFGNTGRIANCVADGLRETGVEVECVNIKEARVDKIAGYELLAVGAPTQYLTASKPGTLSGGSLPVPPLAKGPFSSPARSTT